MKHTRIAALTVVVALVGGCQTEDDIAPTSTPVIEEVQPGQVEPRTVLTSNEEFEATYRQTIDSESRDADYETEVRLIFDSVRNNGWRNVSLEGSSLTEIRCSAKACYMVISHETEDDLMSFRERPYLVENGLPVYDAWTWPQPEELKTFIATTRPAGSLPRLRMEREDASR